MPPLDAPLTADDFLRLVREKQAVAMAFRDDRSNGRQAWLAAGSAVEFALKALIMRRNRWNGWPDRSSQPDLHTHDLRTLMTAAGIARIDIPAHMRGAWKVALSWDHGREYSSRPIPRRVVRDMVEAAFGAEGVVPWLAGQ